MIVLGIDPGQKWGYAVIDSANPRDVLYSRARKLASKTKDGAMDELRAAVLSLCSEWRAVLAAVEDKPFLSGGKNANDWSAVLRTAAAAGAGAAGCTVVTVNPGTWKKNVCGSGALEPKAYQSIINRLFRVTTATHDEAAAIGIAAYAAVVQGRVKA